MKLKPLPLPRHRESLYTRIAGHGAKKPVASPGHDVIPVENREGTDSRKGASGMLAWGARPDIGLVRSHNDRPIHRHKQTNRTEYTHLAKHRAADRNAESQSMTPL